MRKILIVGSGQSGLQLALSLQSHGYDVTVMSARTADEIRSGRVMSTPFSSCCPSLRTMRVAKGVYLPARGLCGAATKAGENGRAAIVPAQGLPPGAEARLKSLTGVAGGLPEN